MNRGEGVEDSLLLLTLIAFSLSRIEFQRKRERPEAFHNCIDRKMNMMNGVHSARPGFIVLSSGR